MHHHTSALKTDVSVRSVLVVNLYYPPDTASTGQLLHELCSDMAKNGMNVHVLTGQPSYSGAINKAPVYENMGGVHVHRVSTMTARGRSSFARRLLSYVSFTFKARRLATKIAKNEQINAVVTVSNPPTVGLIGRRVSRKLNIPFHYILFDIHPDAVEMAGTLRMPPGANAVWRWVNRRIWRAATTIAVPGNYMRAQLIETHKIAPEKIKVLPLWGTPEMSTLGSDKSLRRQFALRDDSLLIVHAGNIGLMHRMIDLIESVGSLSHLGIEMAVTGGGVASESAKEHVRKRGYTNIKFLGYVEEPQFDALLRSADIAATTLVTGMESLSMPSRSLTYLSAGLPLLGIMPRKSDIGDLVIEEQCGWLAESSNEATQILTELSANRTLITSAAQNASKTYTARFTKAAGIRRFSEMITAPPSR